MFDKSGNKLMSTSGYWNGPIIVSMYYNFIGRNFKRTAQHLVKQCEEHDMSCSVVRVDKSEIPDELENNNKPNSRRRKYCKIIPFVIQEFLQELKQPVMYIHADAEIIARPPESYFTNDIMLSRGHGKQKKRWHILGCPVYFKPTDTAYKFLETWIEKCLNSGRAEHAPLKRTYEKYHNEVTEFNCVMSSRVKEDNPYIYF